MCKLGKLYMMFCVAAVWTSTAQAQSPPQDVLEVAKAGLKYAITAHRAIASSAEPVVLLPVAANVEFVRAADGRLAPQYRSRNAWNPGQLAVLAGVGVVRTSPVARDNSGRAAESHYTISITTPVIAGDEAMMAVTTGHVRAGEKRAYGQTESLLLRRQGGTWVVVKANVSSLM